MRVMQIVKPDELKLIGIEKPVITEKGDVLIKMTVAGICGSDVSIYHGADAVATYPRIIGHEMVGRVEEADPGVANSRVGDGVIINQVTSHGHCYSCKIGRGSVRDSLAVWGVHIDGGYRKYIIVPESDYYTLPEPLSDQDTVMIEPITIGIQFCIRADLEEGDLLPIYGSGALDNSILKIIRLLCDHIIVADVVGDKLEVAKANGVTYIINVLKENLIEEVKEHICGHGATVSIDMVCNKNPPTNLLQVIGSVGRITAMDFFTTPAEVDQFLVAFKELDVRGSRSQNKMFGEAIELISKGRLDLVNPAPHTFLLTKTQEAFDSVGSRDLSTRKIVLTSDF